MVKIYLTTPAKRDLSAIWSKVYHDNGRQVADKVLGGIDETITRLNVLSSLIGLPSRTISEVTEPVLIRLGLVTKDGQGQRCLTGRGHEHISESESLLNDSR